MKVLAIESELFGMGLNNQKFALLGLCVMAKNEGAKVIVPKKAIDFSATFDKRCCIATNELMDVEKFYVFLKKWDLWVDQSEEATELFPMRRCFSRGANAVDRVRRQARYPFEDSFLYDFYSCLQVNEVIKEKAQEFLSELDLPKLVVMQLRIERDWYRHVTRKNNMGKMDIRYYSLEDILRKVLATTDIRNKRNFLICCDEEDLMIPSAELKKIAKQKFNVGLFFRKFDFPSYFFKTSAIKNALFDFEICMSAECFIGLTHSTFSNLLCLEKSIHLNNYGTGNAIHPNHYIYNTGDEMIVRKRCDFGTSADSSIAVSLFKGTTT